MELKEKLQKKAAQLAADIENYQAEIKKAQGKLELINELIEETLEETQAAESNEDPTNDENPATALDPLATENQQY